MYKYGKGVQKDILKAVELYTEACDMKEERGYRAHTELK
jgi:TPR repeat protein